MFRRDVFILIGAALIGSVAVVYASFAGAPFFPTALQTTLGECPDSRRIPAHRRPVLEPEEASWFGQQLRLLHEEPLARGGAGRPRTIRFTLLSYPSATAVRLNGTADGRLQLTARWLHPCSDERGCLVEKLLSPSEQARVEAAVAPFLSVPSYGCNGMVDSVSSILEVSDGDAYRLWHERSGGSGDLAEVGSLLLKLAEWPVAHEYRPSASRS